MRTRAQDTRSGLEVLTPAMWLHTSPLETPAAQREKRAKREAAGAGVLALTTSSFKALTNSFHLFVPQLADLQDGGDNIINFTGSNNKKSSFRAPG